MIWHFDCLMKDELKLNRAAMANFSSDLENTFRKIGKDVQEIVEQFTEVSLDHFKPDADIIESDSEFILVLDLPGFTKKDIQISLKNGVINVQGERIIELKETESFKKRERRSGSFNRSIALPEDVSSGDIKATFKNGELRISLPISEVLKDSTHIPIN